MTVATVTRRHRGRVPAQVVRARIQSERATQESTAASAYNALIAAHHRGEHEEEFNPVCKFCELPW